MSQASIALLQGILQAVGRAKLVLHVRVSCSAPAVECHDPVPKWLHQSLVMRIAIRGNPAYPQSLALRCGQIAQPAVREADSLWSAGRAGREDDVR